MLEVYTSEEESYGDACACFCNCGCFCENEVLKDAIGLPNLGSTAQRAHGHIGE